jgi:5-methylcytosine-specific restriction protein A
VFWSIGIDASLTGLGLAAIPADWALRFERVRRKTFKTGSLWAAPGRMGALARDVCRWIQYVTKPGDTIQVWMEGSITNSPDLAYSVRSQLKLAGVIEEHLWRLLELECLTAEQSTIRSLLLGKLPAGDRKAAVIKVLRVATSEPWDPNEYDAFTAANYGLKQNGVTYFSLVGDAHRRTPKLAGHCNPRALEKGPNGFNLCRECRTEVSSKQRTFCSKECIDAWKIKTQPPFARRKVAQRDGGVCAECTLDTAKLERELDLLRHHPEERTALLARHGYRPNARHLWEMDHVKPVVEGGGSCGLDGLRTLCIPCHNKATRALAKRRRDERKGQVSFA